MNNLKEAIEEIAKEMDDSLLPDARIWAKMLRIACKASGDDPVVPVIPFTTSMTAEATRRCRAGPSALWRATFTNCGGMGSCITLGRIRSRMQARGLLGKRKQFLFYS